MSKSAEMNATVLSLFLAGANDVATEHAVIREVVQDWNAQHGSALAAYITVTSWRDAVYPQGGAEPQAIINRQILDSADIVVGVFWTRFGTPTSTAGSGTEEELERSIAAGKKVLVYFSDRPVAPSALDANEYQRVLAFRTKYSTRGLYSVISDIDSFREQFRNHLARVTHDILGYRGGHGKASNEDSISIAFPTKYWIAIVASLNPLVRVALRDIDDLREQGVGQEDLDDVRVTALVTPIIARARVIDVLVKHGVIRPAVGEAMGYDALMRSVEETLRSKSPSSGDEQ